MTRALSLHLLQMMVAKDILTADDSIAAWLYGEKVALSKGLGVHRTNVLGSLTDVLRQAYPCVSKVVDERFFSYMADAFIRQHPPRNAVLSRYGGNLAEFLGTFEPCAHLVYLPDLARLEWMLHRAMRAPEFVSLGIENLNWMCEQNPETLFVRLDPSMSFLESRWAVDRIWQSNMRGSEDGVVPQADELCFLEVRRLNQEVGFRRLSQGHCSFLNSLSQRESLQRSANIAFARDPNFDIETLMRSLALEGTLCEMYPIEYGKGGVSAA
jgi:hypothetical protein